jgi:hypothetical protein
MSLAKRHTPAGLPPKVTCQFSTRMYCI